MDDKSEKCIFIGYSEESKAYRLYNPISKKLIISKDVKFEEEVSWHENDNKQVTRGAPILQSDDELKEQGTQSTPNTPSRNFVQGASPPSSNVSDKSDSTFSTPSYKGKKTRSLKEIYDQEEENVDIYSNFALFSCDPLYFDEAIKEDKWIKAMDEEIDSIERNNTWELMDLPKGKECIGVKWVYKTKFDAKGEIVKHKARLVAKGFSQQYGVDYNETFAPVARLDTVRTILAISTQNDWKVYQMDVKITFLNGFIDEEVYVKQPPSYEVSGHENKVYKLNKALYGLKQAPRAWYKRIDSYMISNQFNRSNNEPTLYVKTNKEGQILIVCLYVDDLIFTRNLSIDMFKSEMMKEFEMTDLRLMRYFLGIEVIQCDKGIFICQSKYIKDVLRRFKMINCNPASTPIAIGTKLNKEEKV